MTAGRLGCNVAGAAARQSDQRQHAIEHIVPARPDIGPGCRRGHRAGAGVVQNLVVARQLVAACARAGSKHISTRTPQNGSPVNEHGKCGGQRRCEQRDQYDERSKDEEEQKENFHIR